MLIFGWRTRQKVLDRGVFFSPALGADGPYERVEVRRWFTLFFLPVIPLNVVGTFVKCATTGSSYDERVLSGPTNAQFMDQLSAAAREVAVAVATANGEVTDAERAAAVDVVRSFNDNYNAETFEADLQRSVDQPLDDRLTFLADALNAAGKERLLTAAAIVMAADGHFHDAQQAAITDIGEKLGMTPAHIRGVVSSISDRAGDV